MKTVKNQHGFAIVETFFILVILGVIGFVGWSVYQNKLGASDSDLASAKPQYPAGQTLTGYVAYNPAKFRQVTNIKFPDVKPNSSDSNVVITQGTLLSKNESGLYLYDLNKNKAFKLTSGGGDPRIMSDHFLIYGFDEGDGDKKQLGAKLLNLQTGETTTVYSGSRTEVPGNACCSVSPDGFKAAIIHKDKLSVWDIRTDEIKDYPVSLSPISEGFYTGNDAPYNVEMSYAKPVWSDNNTVIFANKPAVKRLKDSNPTINTDIFSLDTVSGKATELPTPESGIYDISVTHGQPYILAVGVPGGNESITQIGPTASDQPKLIYKDNDGESYNSLQLAPSGNQIIISGLTYSQKRIFQSYNVPTKKSIDLAFVPAGANPANTNVVARGWLDENQMILEITDTTYPDSHSYIGVVDISTGELLKYVELK